MAYKPNRRKYKGTALATAQKLFGGPRKMETPEERAAAIEVFSHSDKDAFRALCNMARTEIYATTSFAMLAEKVGLNFYKLADEYRAIQEARGLIRAGAHIPDIMEETALNAKGKFKPCQRCEATGKITVKEKKTDPVGREISFPSCEGSGKMYVKPEIEDLRVALEMFQLIKKPGSGGVNVNLDLRKTDGGEALGDLANSVSGIIDLTPKDVT